MTFAYYQANGVKYYWGFGTGISCITMAIGLLYVVDEYCTQSHLSTEDYESAVQGLRTTRTFKKHTMWLRHLVSLTATLLHILTFSIFKSPSKTLAWDYMTKDDRIWSRKVQIINGRRPKRTRTRTGSSSAVVDGDELDSSPKLLSKYERSFSNNTTLADLDEVQHARWYSKALGEVEVEMQGRGAAAAGVGGQSPTGFSEGWRSPLSRESTL